MRTIAATALLVLVACDAKKKQPSPAPPPPPAPAGTRTADECKRRAQDEIMRSDRDISRALAAQKLELFAPQFLQTPFDGPASGLNPAMVEQRRKETQPFEHEQTGDTVTWKRGESSYTGIYVEPIKEGWLIAKRDSQIFIVKPARWREVTCEDPREYTGPCASTGPRPLLFALPVGTTFGGTLDLDAERVALRFTGGPPSRCPP